MEMKDGTAVQSAPESHGNDADDRVAFRQKQQLEVKGEPLRKEKGKKPND